MKRKMVYYREWLVSHSYLKSVICVTIAVSGKRTSKAEDVFLRAYRGGNIRSTAVLATEDTTKIEIRQTSTF